MTLFSVTRTTQARVFSHCGATSTRILHSSARVGRGIAIGGGNAKPGSSSKSSNGTGTPFSALRDELKKQPSNEQPSTSQEARFDAIRQDSQPAINASTATEDAVEQSLPSTSAEARLEHNKQAQKLEFQQSRDETWTAMKERIRSAQKEEKQQEEQAKAAVRQALRQRSSNVQRNSTKESNADIQNAERKYSFQNTIDAQMFINGITSTLLQQSPKWQGSITLQRTSQGHETVKVHLAEGSVLLQSLDKLAERFQSSSSKVQTSNGGRRTQAFRSDSIPQAGQSASVMSGEHSDSSLHETIDGRVPVTIQGEQVPGSKPDSIDAKTGHASQGPVGQALGTSDSHPTSPIEDHTPVPNLHNQSRREFATLFGSGSGGLHSRSQSLTSIIGLNRRPSSANAMFENQRRLLATSNMSIQLSQSTWSQIMNQREYLRVDDYIPVEIDPSQMGKKRSTVSL